MKKNVMNANASVAEAKAQERMNTFFEVFDLEPSQYEAAKIAIDYAVEEVVDPEKHEDAVLGTAFDFLSGFEHARNTQNKSVYFMEIIEEVMLSKGVKAALAYCEDFAEGGNADAAYFLAETYLKGDICRQNEDKGASYLFLAAKLGNPEAQVRLGSFGLREESSEEERKLVFDLFHEAALQGHPEAEMIMSILYHIGYACRKNEKLANMWGLKANIDKCDHEAVLSIMGYDEE